MGETHLHNSVADASGDWESIDFRSLSAFQKVYVERSYTNAGLCLNAARKSIRRMMDKLEKAFECQLFTEGSCGELTATAFSERLFNDLRFLTTAQQRLQDKIDSIHAHGRVLHIGSSPAVFRTRAFRQVFRELHKQEGIRTSYSPVEAVDAGKALVSGTCDLYIGCWEADSKRFVTHDVGSVPIQLFSRMRDTATDGRDRVLPSTGYLVSLDGRHPEPMPIPGRIAEWRPIQENQWLRWLDHPHECPPGTIVCGPDLMTDHSRWAPLDISRNHSSDQDLYVSFLRQHPYEFLSSLTGRIARAKQAR